jgi:hypothetical protein
MSPGVGGLDNVLPPTLPKNSLSAIFYLQIRDKGTPILNESAPDQEEDWFTEYS